MRSIDTRQVTVRPVLTLVPNDGHKQDNEAKPASVALKPRHKLVLAAASDAV